MTFQASQYSSLAPSDSYGDGASNWVEVKDYPGDTFRVYSDGVVEHVKTGTTWSPTIHGDTYKLVVANLADVPGNEEKMAAVMGQDKVQEAIISAPKHQPTTSTPGDPMPEVKIPVHQRTWFWPAVLVSSVVVVGGGAYYYFSQTESGKERWARFRS